MRPFRPARFYEGDNETDKKAETVFAFFIFRTCFCIIDTPIRKKWDFII